MNTATVRALVTGGASGLGHAVAARLVRNGAKVVVADLPSDAAVAAVKAIGAEFVPADVTSADQISAALDQLEMISGGPINVAVNCAGIITGAKTWHPKKGPHSTMINEALYHENQQQMFFLAELIDQIKKTSALGVRISCSWKTLTTLEVFEKILKVNTGGTFNVIRLAADRMVKRYVGEVVFKKYMQAKAEANADNQRGVIVNTASIAAMDGQSGQAAYSASKYSVSRGAIVGMTLPIARDLKKSGIRINTICPGVMATPMVVGLGPEIVESLEAGIPNPSRLGNPDEFAHLVEHVINNGYINGEIIRIDGALRMV